MTSQQLFAANGEPVGQSVLFPPERDIGVLAVFPPYVMGGKQLEDGSVGVNYSMVHSDAKGLLCYILSYINMSADDWIDVSLGNGPATEPFQVTDKYVNQNVPFYISSDTMKESYPAGGGTLVLSCRIERLSGNPENSLPLNLFYKDHAPGELDTDLGNPFNQGLKLPVPSETIIDQNVIAEGMTVTVKAYPFQAQGDKASLAIGTLKPIPELKVQNPPQDIVFELTPEQLKQLPATDKVIVRYQLIDKVHNRSGWSDSVVVQSKPNVSLLPAPVINNADAANVVNHDELAGGPMVVMISGVFASGDVIVLKLVGFTHSGDLVEHSYSMTLTGTTRMVLFDVENERVQVLIRGSVAVTYVLTKKSTGVPQDSKPAYATIDGSAILLRAPSVEQATENELPADTPLANVLVPFYWPLVRGAEVKLYWQVTGNDGVVNRYVFGRTIEDPTQPVTFGVLNKYIAPFANSPLVVQYEITNPGRPPVVSELLKLQIGELAIVLSAPKVLKALNGMIPDPLLFPDGAIAQVEVLGKPGDKVKLIVKGAPGAGSPTFEAKVLNTNNRANFTLDKAFIAANMGKQVQLSYEFFRVGQEGRPSLSMTLTVGTIADNHPSLPIPGIVGATGPELHVTQLNDTNPLQVAAWPLQVVGQRMWLRYDGFDAGGKAIFFEDLKGEPHNTLGDLTRPAPLEWLKTLKDGSALTISFSVSFDGVGAVRFPVRTYTVKALNFGSSNHVQPINNYFIVQGRPPSVPPVRGSYTRTATGGTEPYRYSSSNSQVALVDPATGTVRAGSNGFAIITVTDAAQNTASYRIEFSGITLVTLKENIWWDSSGWPQPPKENALSLAELRVFWETYYPSEGPVAAALGWPRTLYWSSNNISVIGDAWAFRLNENIGSGDGKVQTIGGTRLPVVSKII
ncbi:MULTISPECIES: Ig-like domain-containing protein [Pseudomonas]|uniref:BIG2 domain-containing protein n=1 Tax=Pseudomonas fluorescens TaxID=294 RepID=A0A162BP74_PSEFL|nr:MULTISPECIES: Ig-like domain-containing protein [Pseudomonas]KZN18303.1 hypothetical protein A1D17_19865 [Pseudomonas fluorescens]